MNSAAKEMRYRLAIVTFWLGITIVLLIGEHVKVVRLERDAAHSNHMGNRLMWTDPTNSNEKPVADLWARELSLAYIENSPAADKMFDRKVLQVMGGVAGTRGWTDGASVVSMNNGVNGRSIVCIFGSPDIHLLDRFHPGSIVIVRGYFQRSGDSMLLVCSKLEIR